MSLRIRSFHLSLAPAGEPALFDWTAVIEVTHSGPEELGAGEVVIEVRDAAGDVVATLNGPIDPLGTGAERLLWCSGRALLKGGPFPKATATVVLPEVVRLHERVPLRTDAPLAVPEREPELETETEPETEERPARRKPTDTDITLPNAIQALYDRLAAGEPAPPMDGEIAGRVLQVAREGVKHPDAGARIGAVRAAAAVGGQRAMEVVRNFLRDESAEVRRAAVDAALGAGEDGLLVLRDAATLIDPAIAVAALDRLRELEDRQVTGRARSQLGSDHPRVREAAIRLLGVLGGRALAPPLRRLLDDPDDGVRAAVEEALARIEGRAATTEEGPVLTGSTSTPHAASTASDEVRARLAALGEKAGDPDALEALRALEPAQLARALQSVRSDDAAEIARGAARAAEALNVTSMVPNLRRLLNHEDAGARAAAAEAVGRLGGPGILPLLARTLEDPAPEVRARAALALARAASQHARADVALRWLNAVEDDGDERVQRAKVEARRLLEVR